ncbi:MAG: LytTR family DNA-binding domain-containing protein [Flavobacteriales bacterium]|jgi:DNA-binding LytR/AlgR family response regulator|nr:LytTR family DNA-binding domain-containing protein [Flavobacteriales bacterium]
MRHKTYTCIVVEDNKPSLDLIKYYIQETPRLNLIGTFSQFIDAKELILSNPNAILFLDIILRKENSIEILENKPLKNPIVFLTGYKEYAYKAFNINAMDYLLKPITRIQFDKCINKILPKLRISEYEINKNSSIFISINRKLRKVDYVDIYYIESEREYCLFHTKEGILRTKMSLKSVEEKVPNISFQKIHRSFIVNINYIDKIVKNDVEIQKRFLPIGRSYKSIIRRRLL